MELIFSFLYSRYSCVDIDPAIMAEKITVKFLKRSGSLFVAAIWAISKYPGPFLMDEFDYTHPPKNNRYSKAKEGKSRENSKKEKKKSNRLSSIERDYIENVGSGGEEFECLGESELLESLDKLNFVFSESESIDEQEYLSKSSKKKKKDNLGAENGTFIEPEYYPVDNFSQFNRDVKLFLKDEEEFFETAPAAPEIRRYIHLLGNLYRLKTFTVGKGIEKRTILQKTDYSGLANNTRQLDKVIEQGNKAVKWCNGDYESKGKGKSGRKGKKIPSNNSSTLTKPADGSIVGAKSAPIKEDNVGNQMLQKMGWTPGTGLGRDSAGIVNHIPAVVKTKRTGLI